MFFVLRVQRYKDFSVPANFSRKFLVISNKRGNFAHDKSSVQKSLIRKGGKEDVHIKDKTAPG
jgi:hypothetical protein